METGFDKMEVRATFRRNIGVRVEMSAAENTLIECIADAITEVINDNNIRILQQIKTIKNTNLEMRV